MNLNDWGSLYLPETDWYTAFISTVKIIYEMSIPLVRMSRSRIKDKHWITKGLKKSIRNNHRLYRLSIRNGNNDSKKKLKEIQKYTTYKKVQKIMFTKACLKIQEHHPTTCGALYDLSSIPENIWNELLHPKWGVMDRSPQMTRLFPKIWINSSAI